MTPYLNLGNKKDSLIGKAWTVIRQDAKVLRFVRKHHIDLGLSSGMVLGHVSKLTRMKSFMFDDDDDAAEPLVVKYGHPDCEAVFTPQCIQRKTKHAVYYAGTHELAYLHPNRFTPDKTVLKNAGLAEGVPVHDQMDDVVHEFLVFFHLGGRREVLVEHEMEVASQRMTENHGVCVPVGREYFTEPDGSLRQFLDREADILDDGRGAAAAESRHSGQHLLAEFP